MDRMSFLERVLRGLLLTLIVIFFLFPIFWILLMSFQTNEQILRIPPSLSFVPTLDNYKALISGHLHHQCGLRSTSPSCATSATACCCRPARCCWR